MEFNLGFHCFNHGQVKTVIASKATEELQNAYYVLSETSFQPFDAVQLTFIEKFTSSGGENADESLPHS